MSAPVSEISATELSDRLRRSAVDLVDVREPGETAAGFVAGAKLIPLAHLRERAGELSRDRPTVVMCRSGVRSTAAIGQLADLGFTGLHNLRGGIMSWQAAGLPVEKTRTRPMSMERQAKIATGLVMLLGWALAHWMHPAFLWLSVGMGAGLIIGGLTNTGGMGLLLMFMPWNRRRKAGQ